MISRCAWPVRAAATLVVAFCGLVGILTARQSTSAFRGGVELFTVKVQVLANRGKALPRLAAEQFDVRVGGRKGRVVLAEPVRFDDGGTGVDAGLALAPDAVSFANDTFFKPFPHQLSALYVLGVDPAGVDPGRMVRVRVNQRDVKVRGWVWCGNLAKCGTPLPQALPLQP